MPGLKLMMSCCQVTELITTKLVKTNDFVPLMVLTCSDWLDNNYNVRVKTGNWVHHWVNSLILETGLII